MCLSVLSDSGVGWRRRPLSVIGGNQLPLSVKKPAGSQERKSGRGETLLGRTHPLQITVVVKFLWTTSINGSNYLPWLESEWCLPIVRSKSQSRKYIHTISDVLPPWFEANISSRGEHRRMRTRFKVKTVTFWGGEMKAQFAANEWRWQWLLKELSFMRCADKQDTWRVGPKTTFD